MSDSLFIAPLVALDYWIVLTLGELVGRWPAFDAALVTMTYQSLWRGGVIVCLLWAVWAWRGPSVSLRESKVVETLGGVAVAIVLGRVLQLVLPFRPRPINEPALDLTPAALIEAENWSDWSSFPSDNATLFVALSLAIFFNNRWLGTLAFLWTAIAILLPRIYLGLHYPTDILAGAILGLAIMWASFSGLATRLVQPLVTLANDHPRLTFVALFLASFEITETFDSLRALLKGVAYALI